MKRNRWTVIGMYPVTFGGESLRLLRKPLRLSTGYMYSVECPHTQPTPGERGLTSFRLCHLYLKRAEANRAFAEWVKYYKRTKNDRTW